MNNYNIKPSTVQKPIQLLAAWLVGLIATNGLFLAAAAKIKTPLWVVPTLVIASIIYVPLFLFCIFLLQTKYRPEMQEDSYYADYLKSKTTPYPPPTPPVDVEAATKKAEEAARQKEGAKVKLATILKEFQITVLASVFKTHRVIAELYAGTGWNAFSNQWKGNDGFKSEVRTAINANLVRLSDDKSKLELTEQGRAVCKRLQKSESL